MLVSAISLFGSAIHPLELVLNRGKLTVFTHAQTGNALKDHTQHVIWLGPSETLKLDQFR